MTASDLAELQHEAARRMSAAESEIHTLADCGLLPPGAVDLVAELRDAACAWGVLSAERMRAEGSGL